MRVTRSLLSKALSVVTVVAVLCVAGPAARAQVPSVPALPAPVQDALNQLQSTTGPVIVQGATASQPVLSAVGFTLRPACGAPVTSVAVVLVIGQLPLDPGFVRTPINLLCAGVFGIGPADPVFGTVDQAAGAQLHAAAQPLLDQIGTALAPARPNLGAACLGVGLAVPPTYFLPPPLARFDVTHEVCSG